MKRVMLMGALLCATLSAVATPTPGWNIAALLLLCVFGLVGIIVLTVVGFLLYKMLKK